MKSCKQASFLMSKKLDTSLSIIESISLKIHLAMCKSCAECDSQLLSIHTLCQKRHIDTSMKNTDTTQ